MTRVNDTLFCFLSVEPVRNIEQSVKGVGRNFRAECRLNSGGTRLQGMLHRSGTVINSSK